MLTVQGNGNATASVTILFDTNAQMNSTGWWGASQLLSCSFNCSGAITVNNFNYITIDGQNTGVIQNLLAGTKGQNCAGGPCTQQPGAKGSLGVLLRGDHLVLRNLTIQNIYNNTGATDSSGEYTGDVDVCCNGSANNVQIYNNMLANARAAIFNETSGTTGPNDCPSSGICYYNNTLTDHSWQASLNGSGVINFYANDVSGYSNWFWPSQYFHLDGIITWGDSSVITDNIFNNYFHGDQVGPQNGSPSGYPTGFVFCTNSGTPNTGSGSICNIFNNLFIGEGSEVTQGQALYFHAALAGDPEGPYSVWNNTFAGFNFQIYFEGDSSTHFSIQNNVGLATGNAQWFESLSGSGGSTQASQIVSDNNVWYNGNPWGAFALNYFQNCVYNCTLPTWRGDGLDGVSLSTNPGLSSAFTPPSGSSVIGQGKNLSSLGITALDYDKPVNVGVGFVGAQGNARSMGGKCTPGTSGCWDAGAYQYASSNKAPDPPTGLTAKVN